MAAELATQEHALTALERIARDPQTDAGKLVALYDLMERERAFRARQEFQQAVASVQAKNLNIRKNKENKFARTTYADLEQVVGVLAPILQEAGLTISFSQAEAAPTGMVRLQARVAHTGGHVENFYSPDFPPDDAGAKGNANKTPIQALGSTVSYVRRYLLCMLFNVTTTDDTDGADPGRQDASAYTPEQVEAIRAACAAYGRDADKALAWGVEYGRSFEELKASVSVRKDAGK